MKELKTLDCRGLSCPQPVINTKNAMREATGPIRVIVDGEAACTNVRLYAESQGAEVEVTEQGGALHLTIEHGAHQPSGEELPVLGSTTPTANMVVYVSSEGMGRGDDTLGGILMEAFLDTLSQFKGDLSHAIFVNAGAKLVVDGSPVLGQVRQLEDLGVQVLVCGTCLNHFGIQDKLAVGNVSNMYAIIETLSKAGKIIRP